MDYISVLYRKEAREEGKQEGEYNKALEIAKGLTSLLDIYVIAEKVGIIIALSIY